MNWKRVVWKKNLIFPYVGILESQPFSEAKKKCKIPNLLTNKLLIELEWLKWGVHEGGCFVGVWVREVSNTLGD